MKRFEYKYLVPNEQIGSLREAVRPFVAADTVAPTGSGAYTVRSIYFDTPDLRCYLDKVEGVHSRIKLRIRGYDCWDENSTVFLEIKRRAGLPSSKNRAPVRFGDVPELLLSGNVERFVQASEKFPSAVDDARRFLFHVHRSRMRPVIGICYEREAYIGRFDQGIRVTCDRNLRSTLFPEIKHLFNDERMSPVFSRYFILEVKFRSSVMPVWARSMIQRFESRWKALSKYVLTIDSHDLPRHRLVASTRSQSLLSLWTLQDGSEFVNDYEEAMD